MLSYGKACGDRSACDRVLSVCRSMGFRFRKPIVSMESIWALIRNNDDLRIPYVFLFYLISQLV